MCILHIFNGQSMYLMSDEQNARIKRADYVFNEWQTWFY